MLIGITGSTGFIGSHLTKYLLSQGHRVRAFSRSGFKLDYSFDSLFETSVVDYNCINNLSLNFQGLDQ